MWSLIKIIDTDEITYYDVVPNKWIVNDGHCLYPVARVSTIKKLAKENTDCKKDWEVFSMIIIERDISDYERGYKMMIKANKKQSESNLESDFEMRGKGCRNKTTSSKLLFEISSSDEDIALDNNGLYPLTSSTEILEASLPTNIERQLPTPPPILLKSATKRTYNSISTLAPTSSSISSAILSTPVDSDKFSKPVCPLNGTRYSKNEHRCSSSDLCFISADIMKLRNTVSYIKHHLIDKDTTDDKKPVVVSNYEIDNYVFPIKSEDGLKMLENKLEDIEYFHKLVSTVAFTVGGIKSLSKMTTSTMKIMFSDEFIANYSWKGQKKKKSLEARPIHKVIISAIQHKFPTTTKAGIIEFISPWMAQSETRIKRNAIKLSSLTTEAIDDPVTSDQPI